MTPINSPGTLAKTPTGIPGFDEITVGGLPKGRPSLVSGPPGCGKTLLASSFLLNGATMFDEPGVFISFEEREEDLAVNLASLGYDLRKLVAERKLVVDHVRVDRHEIDENGEFDLDGLFIRLGYAVDSIGAKRVVLDTVETLFAGFSNLGVLRSELRRLFGWIKERGLTAVITGERGDEGRVTRQGLEEYVSDCVIILDNRVEDQISTRRVRIVKYRGSAHGTHEYPFFIDEQGIRVLPWTMHSNVQTISNEIVSAGVTGIDALLRKGGFFRGSSVLLSGLAGTGKSTISAHFIDAACRRGELSMIFAYEESADEICRNALSVGLDLRHWMDAGLLRIQASRSSIYGLEMHLARMYRDLDLFKPAIVVVDPISAFRGKNADVYTMLLNMVDMIKSRGITGMFTSLQNDDHMLNQDDQSLSSLMDTWIRLSDIEADGERNRVIYVIKARGMSHSNQVREYRMTDTGLELIAPYLGPEGVVTGAARLTQYAREKAATTARQQEIEQRHRDVMRRREALESQIGRLRGDLEAAENEARVLLSNHSALDVLLATGNQAVADRRGSA